MKFQFRLERFLNIVRMRETMKKMEVAAVMQKMNYLKNKKAAIQEGIREMLAKTQKSIDMDWFQYQTVKIEYDVREQKKIDALLAEEQVELDLRQRELAELIERRKSLEALREKRLKDHRVAEGRRIQKQLDDLYQLTRNR